MFHYDIDPPMPKPEIKLEGVEGLGPDEGVATDDALAHEEAEKRKMKPRRSERIN